MPSSDAEDGESRNEATIGQFVSVAHDFNNLLGVILNYTSLLTTQVTDPTALADLDEIRKAAERAAELTHQLQALARRDVATPEAIDLAQAARREEAGARRRILLAEDEAALRSATDRILTAEGYEVLAACDGVEAMEIFEREGGAVDLLLTDVVMPRLRGDDLARELVERRPSLPVVLVSGHGFGDDVLPGRQLEKPVPTDELLRTIREALED